MDDATLKSSGAAGIIKSGEGVQVIYGPKVTVVKSRLEAYLKDPISDNASANVSHNNASTTSSSNKSVSDATILSPMTGKVIKLSDVADEAFSSEAMGKGIAIEPTEGKVYAPFDGVVETAFPTKHAMGLTSDSGIELLIHVGMDTVKLNGEHFVSHISDGQKIKKGDLLLEFDIEAIKKAGYPIVTPIIVTNTADYSDIAVLANASDIKNGESLLDAKK